MRRAPVVLALTALTAAIAPSRSAGINIVECNGTRPTGPETVQYEVGENKPLAISPLGIMCLPAGHTVSSSPVDWGDGTTSAPRIEYVETNGGTQQAWVSGVEPHGYPRATCPRGFCHQTFTIGATLTDEQTGEVFPLRARIEVVPVLDVIALAPMRASAHHLFRGRIADVHTGGLRRIHEMTARVDWGDGSPSSRARVRGDGRDFTFRASHRWRVPGTYNVLLTVRDRFTGARMPRYLRARVTG